MPIPSRIKQHFFGLGHDLFEVFTLLARKNLAEILSALLSISQIRLRLSHSFNNNRHIFILRKNYVQTTQLCDDFTPFPCKF